MTDTRHAKANKGNRVAFGVLIVIVSLFCLLSLVGALGGVGRMVYSFLAGFFGLAAYAYSLVGLIIGSAIVFNISPKMRLSRALTYFGLLFVGILALNVYTSSAHIIGANYGEYLLACYHNTNTAGGMLFGLASYPLMKALTSVGALVVVCVLFFILAFFAIYPAIKRNVTYTVSSSKDRRALSQSAQSKSSASISRRKSAGGHRIESAYAPTITDFSQGVQEGAGLYVVDVQGDPMPLKSGRRAKGADGYKPLDTFNPLYPNAQGAFEDEQKTSQFTPAINNAYPLDRSNDFGAEKFSARSIAKDILFGNGPSADNLSKFGTVSDPRNALNNVSAPYNAVRRSDLHAKLGIDNTSQSAIKEDFMARYRAYQPDIDNAQQEQAPKQPEQPPQNDTLDFKDNFSALKQEQTKLFGERYAQPVYEAQTHDTQQDESVVYAQNEKKEVVKPTKVVSDKEASIKATIQKAEDAVNKPQVTVGMLGALNRAMSGEEQPKPVERKEELISQAYDLPSTNNKVYVVDAKPKEEEPQQKPLAPTKKQTSIEDIEKSGYKAVQGEMKIPRAFSGTAINGDVKPSPYKMSEVPPMPQRTAYVDNDSFVGGSEPSEPAPVQQQVTGGNMSRTAIQSATAIAKTSPRDKESAEVEARIQNIKKAIKETPPVGKYEREALLKEEKVKASQNRGAITPEPKKVDANKERVTQVSIEQAIQQVTPKRPYIAPPISLLTPPAPEVDQGEDYELKKERIVKTLEFFSITSSVFDILVGPTFTMYKLHVEMPKGRTINYLSSLENDIAMKMEVSSVRIIAPIPGENAVGIEVPNKIRRNVNLSEVLQSPQFNGAKAPATFALGVNLYGESKVAEVKKLPHVLIAGATGAGKSCCINSVIISLLYKASPDDVRLILIDPKAIEMSVYAGIPHLLMDEIITETDKAIRALNWAISEMERRIKYLASVGYRDIDEYNADCEKNKYEKMPRIIIIVDEFADLMSTGKKAVEDTVNRIARLARAVGIHLVLATQRPSVDVISGTIKNNFPSRIAFKVTSSFDSKTVLDAIGADKLLGYGDMLYMLPGASMLERMQGAFISNEEVKRVVDFVKAKNDAVYDSNIKDAIFKEKQEEKPSNNSGGGKGQTRYDPSKITQDLCDTLLVGIEMREDPTHPSMSISCLQSKLGFGWPKASRLFTQMQTLGYIAIDENDRKRKIVTITRDELDELKAQIESDDDEE